jgi:DNA-binding HxlR family transcriptional regulator
MLHGQRFPWMADKSLKCCPIDYAFKIIGKKFTLLIIRNMLLYNQTRFSEFEESIEKINPKILSIRLRELEKAGLISRRVYDEIPVRVEYNLTDKGLALRPLLEFLSDYSSQYYPKEVLYTGTE